jgi:hypothetical protein
VREIEAKEKLFSQPDRALALKHEEINIQVPMCHYDDEKRAFFIDNIQIHNDVFMQEKVNWRFEEREELIDQLYDWIGEAKHSDRTLMIQDVQMLHRWPDKIILSSILTNDYISPILHPVKFTEICQEILQENNALKNKD